jgi:hypothetical protein
MAKKNEPLPKSHSIRVKPVRLQTAEGWKREQMKKNKAAKR